MPCRDATGSWLTVGTRRGLHLYRVLPDGNAQPRGSAHLRFIPKVGELGLMTTQL